MQIYIDEAGPFATPKVGVSKVSCVGSLVLPEGSEAGLTADYARLRRRWGVGEAESKGGSLTEAQAAEFVGMLVPYDVVAHVAAVDMGLYTDAEVTRFKARQADSIRVNLRAESGPETVERLRGLRDQMLGLSNVLTVQLFLTAALLRQTRRITAAYYAGREWAEAGDVAWIFDAKDIRMTRYEQQLPLLLGALVGQEIAAGSFAHVDSRTSLGLQLADNVVTICRRALNDTLMESGWGEIGRLFVRDGVGETVSYLRLDTEKETVAMVGDLEISARRHLAVMRRIGEKARPPSSGTGSLSGDDR